MSKPKTVCIDLDGTIAHYTEWRGETHFGEPIEGVRQALEQIQQNGWKIIIFTTRSNTALIEEYLHEHSIPFDFINFNPDQPANAIGGKIYADAYIDDRAVPFNGDWQATLKEVLQFVPWENRGNQPQEVQDV
jgi:hydroxymethylpyrimidine pyrophosphatase-like HAD family hydrolase